MKSEYKLSKNGFLYYQLSDGTITMKSPFKSDELEKKFKLLIKKL